MTNAARCQASKTEPTVLTPGQGSELVGSGANEYYERADMSFSTPARNKTAAILLILSSCAFCQRARAADVQDAKLPPPAMRPVDFAKDIQPILTAHCYSCHGPEKQKSDLRWDNKASVFKGGE